MENQSQMGNTDGESPMGIPNGESPMGIPIRGSPIGVPSGESQWGISSKDSSIKNLQLGEIRIPQWGISNGVSPIENSMGIQLGSPPWVNVHLTPLSALPAASLKCRWDSLFHFDELCANEKMGYDELGVLGHQWLLK